MSESHGGVGGGRVGGGDRRRPAQLLTSQGYLDPIGLGLDVAAAGVP
ncbi:hypothetical protein [Rhodococcus sp. IEGM 1307]|nr:hypothetical protein [Rhodococcus sp. IEGM 1307]MDI9978942.1 hypothetical protein [Rhodococcus sp. IEGM 1307]